MSNCKEEKKKKKRKSKENARESYLDMRRTDKPAIMSLGNRA